MPIRKYAGTITHPGRSPFPLTREEVEHLYLVEEKSLYEISTISGRSRQSLARWMEYWGIPRREQIESMRLSNLKRKIVRGPNYKTGRYYDSRSKTSFIYMPEHHRHNCDGYVISYIPVLEDRLGRLLKKGEVVHHLDTDRDNNSPENLCGMNDSQHRMLHANVGHAGMRLACKGHQDLVREQLKGYIGQLFDLVYIQRVPSVIDFVKS